MSQKGQIAGDVYYFHRHCIKENEFDQATEFSSIETDQAAHPRAVQRDSTFGQ
jgi:hypothetical protein